MNEAIAKVENVFLRKKDDEKLRLNYYEEIMDLKQIIEMNFSASDLNGNLYFYENMIRVQMDNLDVSGSEYKSRYRANILSKTYSVLVTSVDRINRIVHVSHKAAKKTKREEFIPKLNEAIDNNQPMTVMAKVIRVDETSDRVFIDIGGVNIDGLIRKSHWSTVYTSNLKLVAFYGDIIKVVVQKKVLFNGRRYYECSRRDALTDNLWAGIEQKYPVYTIVNLRCIDKKEKSFFGKIDGLDEISAYCEYPDKDIRIELGDMYQGYVASVSEETKLLRIRIFKKLDE